MLQARGLTKRYGGLLALDNVSFELHRGEIVGYLGPNGSGKTTFLRAVLGLQRISAGEIRLFGTQNRRGALKRVGYVPQRMNLERSFILSVREFLALRLRATRHWFWHSKRSTDERIEASMEEMGIRSLLERPLAALSGGQLQRVLIAFSLLSKPDLLLLDEPTAGVDVQGEESFYDLIAAVQKRHRLSAVLVSHDLSMVYRHASWVYALNGVVCCEGTPEQVMNAESLRQAYGLHVSPYGHHHHVH